MQSGRGNHSTTRPVYSRFEKINPMSRARCGDGAAERVSIGEQQRLAVRRPRLSDSIELIWIRWSAYH